VTTQWHRTYHIGFFEVEDDALIDMCFAEFSDPVELKTACAIGGRELTHQD
jgi:hypothetical protein